MHNHKNKQCTSSKKKKKKKKNNNNNNNNNKYTALKLIITGVC